MRVNYLRSLKSTFLKSTHMRIPTVYLSLKADSTYLQIDAVNSVDRCMDTVRCWMIKDKLCLNERSSKTDLHGLAMCFLWSSPIIKCLPVTFLLLQACLSEIYLFCRIGGLLKIFFSRGEFSMRLQFAINVFLRSCTTGWYVVTIGNSLSLPFLLLFLFKTEFIVIGTWQQLAKVNIASIGVGGDANIVQVTSVKNHGSWFDHITFALILLHWLPACFTTKYKILILRQYWSSRQFMVLV